MKFSNIKIEDAIEDLIDYRGKTPLKSDSGVKLITAKVIKEGRILNDKHEYITEATYDDWMSRGFPQEGDVLITTEAPLGEIAQIRNSEKIALAQRVILLRANKDKVLPNYLFQALKSPITQARLEARATGTTVLGISQKELRKVEIPYFDFPIQHKISNILSAFDDLIENNTRRIEILEEMARQIYREWFVHFRYPGHEKDKLVDSGTELGEIPEGWEVRQFGNLVSFIRDRVKNEDVQEKIPVLGLGDMPKGSITLSEWEVTEDIGSTKLKFKRDDILFGKIRPYFHKVGFAQTDGVCSSDIFIWRPKDKKDLPLALLVASSEKFVETATNSSSGTKMPRAKWDVLGKYPVAYPPEGLLGKFNSTIVSSLKQIRTLSLQNKRLKEARDLLLPKLISGKIQMEEININ